MAVSTEALLAVARDECERRGWPITTDLGVEHRLFSHVVHARLQDHGGCVVIRVGRWSGRVVGFRPSFGCVARPEGIFRTLRPCPHRVPGRNVGG